jgi:phenylacetate-CoA ligase
MLTDFYLFYKMNQLKKNLRRTQEEIFALREKKFRKILKHAYDNSGFYRDYYMKNGIKKEHIEHVPISQLPITDKKLLMDNFDSVVTDKRLKKDVLSRFVDESRDPGKLFMNRYYVVNSSGSSGNTGIFVYSKYEFIEAFSCNGRLFEVELGQRLAFFGGVDQRFGGVTMVKLLEKGILKYFYKTCLLDMNLPLNNVIETLNKFQPTRIVAYGMGLVILAKAQREGKLQINPRMIGYGGEGIKENDLKMVKETFKIPIYNMYSTTECYYMGLGIEEYEGMYLMDDFNYIEIMDDHVLITNLYNYTQPIIRYKINDIVTLKEDKKKLLPFRLADNVVGRDEMLLWFNNQKGEMDCIHPLVFTSFFVKGLDKFQILLKTENEFDFLAVIEPGYDKGVVAGEIESGLNDIMKKKEMQNVKFTVREISDPIIDKKSRKYRMVIKDY